MPPLKAISLLQPWASLLVSGEKRYETRGWKTPYRGLLAVSASKSMPDWAQELCETDHFDRSLLRGLPPEKRDQIRIEDDGWSGIRLAELLPRGALIGVVELMDCVCTNPANLYPDFSDDLEDIASVSKRSQRLPLSTKEREFGDYTPGRYVWITRRAAVLDTPIPCRGQLNLWTVNTDAAAILLGKWEQTWGVSAPQTFEGVLTI